MNDLTISTYQTGFYIAYAGEMDCPICGKHFSYTAEYAWKAGSSKVCSYRCQREYEREKVEKRRKRSQATEEQRKEREKVKAESHKMTSEDKAKIRALREQGVSFAEIGRQIGRHKEAVRSYVRNWELRENYQDGRPSPFAGHMPEIIKAHEQGDTWHEIAVRYGSNSANLKYWVKRYKEEEE